MEAVERMIGELEIMDRELLTLDPVEFGRIGDKLARREVLINALSTRTLDGPERRRLRVIWQNGKQLEDKLVLVKAAIKAQMQDLYREGFLLRALSAALDPPPVMGEHTIDYNG
ncbi:MAG: hypothetical protein U0Q16_35220 [Bryobacteraceae bacterium]